MSAHAEHTTNTSPDRTSFHLSLDLAADVDGIRGIFGYIHLPVVYMLVILMGASIIKAALIVAYFMHLRFERLPLVLTIVPAVVICICLLLVFFPDSFRSRDLRATPPATAPPAGEPSH